MNYVAGFLFDDKGEKVALIHKKHGPDAVVGRWNAIGGKITPGAAGLPDESGDAAMRREFLEEAGVDVSWTLFLRLRGMGWQVEFYHAFSTEALSKVRTNESETVEVFAVDDLPNTVPDLRWIIPMALGHKDDHVWVYEVVESEAVYPDRDYVTTNGEFVAEEIRRLRERNAKLASQITALETENKALKADFDWLDTHVVRVSNPKDELIFFRAPGASPTRTYIAEARSAGESPNAS